MGNLSRNISRAEIACNCGCGFDSIDSETVLVVQDVCDHFAEQPGLARIVLHINSAARCFRYNRSSAVGSNDNSQHPLARALDIRIDGVASARVYAYLDKKYPGRYGIGNYKTFTHIDTRSNGPARW